MPVTTPTGKHPMNSAHRTPLVTGTLEEMNDERDRLRARMAERGLHPTLLIGQVTKAKGRFATDDTATWGLFYQRPEKEEKTPAS